MRPANTHGNGARWIARSLCPVVFLALFAPVDASWTGDGATAFKEGRYDDALVAFRREAAGHPDSPEALANVGAACSRLGRHDEALQTLERALTLGPTPRVEAAIRFDQGNALLALDRIDEAIEAYKASLRLNPSDRQAQINLELALRRQPPKPPPPPPAPSGGEGDGEREGRPPPPSGSGASAPPEDAIPDRPRMTREEAERLLDAIERRERLVFPKRRSRAGEIVERDW